MTLANSPMVIKIGGSLLSAVDVVPRLRDFVASLESGPKFLLFGGGDIINAVRRLDEIHRFDATQTHWRCVDLLDYTFEVAKDLFPTFNSIAQWSDEATNLAEGTISMVRVAGFYDRDSVSDLPSDWRTTTDAIAIELAKRCGGRRVILLKSCDVPVDHSISKLSRDGIVDAATPAIAAQLSIDVDVRRLP